MGRKGFVATAAAVWVFATMAPLAAQETVGTPPPAEQGWTVPKTQWGDPDLRGTYPLDAVGRSPMQRRREYGAGRLRTEGE